MYSNDRLNDKTSSFFFCLNPCSYKSTQCPLSLCCQTRLLVNYQSSPWSRWWYNDGSALAPHSDAEVWFTWSGETSHRLGCYRKHSNVLKPSTFFREKYFYGRNSDFYSRRDVICYMTSSGAFQASLWLVLVSFRGASVAYDWFDGLYHISHLYSRKTFVLPLLSWSGSSDTTCFMLVRLLIWPCL